MGATVHIAGRGKERLDDAAASDPELHGHQADGSKHEEISTLAEEIGSIDWLIITLSGSEGPGPIADLDLGMLRRAFDAKFWGHITTIQAALPHLAPAGSITLLGAIGGLLRLLAARNPFFFPVAVFPLVFPITFYIAHTSLRHRHPCDPIIALLVAIALLGGRLPPGAPVSSGTSPGELT